MREKTIIFAALTLVFFAAAMRLLPHLPNFTPVAAIGLVGSLYLGKRWAFTLPIAAVFLSDLVIGFYGWQIMLSVYASFAIIGLAGWISAKSRSLFSVGLFAAGSSLLFFLITNAVVWYYSPWYEKSFTGLMYSYELGLPFFRNMLFGDLIYTAGLILVIEGVAAFAKFRSHSTAYTSTG